MLRLYQGVLKAAIRRAFTSWPAALSLVVYGGILAAGFFVTARLGIVGAILMGLLMAACWSSYVELISQAVRSPRFRVTWSQFKQTFVARFSDVISVMFALWIISFVTSPMTTGPQGAAIAGILGFAMAFFFNAVPELLYQGQSRSFALLFESAKFVMEHPVAWLLPNVVLMGLVLLAGGSPALYHPGKFLVVFGGVFSSPMSAAVFVFTLPVWAWPLLLFGLHFAMVFRGLLFQELSSGRGSARWQAFRSSR